VHPPKHITSNTGFGIVLDLALRVLRLSTILSLKPAGAAAVRALARAIRL